MTPLLLLWLAAALIYLATTGRMSKLLALIAIQLGNLEKPSLTKIVTGTQGGIINYNSGESGSGQSGSGPAAGTKGNNQTGQTGKSTGKWIAE